MSRWKLGLILVASACIPLLAACGSADKGPSSTSPTPLAATATPVTSASTESVATSLPTSPAGGGTLQGGGRDLVEARSQASTLPTLVNVTTADQGDHDRITFEFQANGLPGYRVEYFLPPAQCGSGTPVPIAGSVFLKVVFTATALNQTELAPGLPTLAEAKQTCDFDGEVTWALGLNSVADFRLVVIDNPTRLAIDVAHP